MSAAPWDEHFGFFTPLRCVQNDSGGVVTLTTWNEKALVPPFFEGLMARH